MVQGQGSNIYDLLTEPALTRPLTPHKGILQLSGGYGHLNGNNYFDATGTKLPFTEHVQTMIEHGYHFDLSYGIIEHLEFHAAVGYRNRHETLPTYLIDNHGNIGYEDRTFQTKGLTNFDFDLKYRLPVFMDGFDMYISGGISAPVTPQHTKTPEHSILIVNPADPGSAYVLQYNYNYASGSPAMFYFISTRMLYAIEKIGLSVNINMQMPFGEVETYNWKERLYGEDFFYEKIPFLLRPKGMIFGGVHMEAQPFPWFGVNIGYDIYKETPGWSDETGQAVALTTSSSGFVSAGFEIQISTHLRILQEVNIPIMGKNLYSEFRIQTGFTYSLVPLKNHYY